MRKTFGALLLIIILSMIMSSCNYMTSKGTGSEEMRLKERKLNQSSMPEIENPNRITLEPNTVYQTIEGFGTTGCWWAQDVGGWQQEKIDKIIDLLFNKQTGIGLNIYRFEVGGGGVNNSSDPWRRAESFESVPGVYNWNKDSNSVNILRKATKAGVDDVMFFSNSPPGRMTKNGKTTGGDSGTSNLKDGMEGEFAKYLVDIALHFKAEGIPVRYISPINEPQWDWQENKGQEGCHYEPDQIVKVSEALAKELARRSPDIRPSLIDSGKWFDGKYSVQLYERLAKDPIVGPMMDHFAIHSYWSNTDDKQVTYTLFQKTGINLPLWQTEWCQMESGRDLGMDAALVLAETVHDDLVTANCSAWISWLAVSCFDYKDGLIYVNLNDRQVFESKRLWAFGNYSRFISKGYKRIHIAGGLENILTSAYISPDGNTAVLVAINPSSMDKNIKINAGDFVSYKAYETSDEHSLDLVAKGKLGIYTLKPRSVTTLIIKK